MKFKASLDDTGARLDVTITKHADAVSRAFVGKLFDQNKVTVNGQKERPSYKIRENDTIEVDFDFEQAQIIPDIDLPVLYEDDDCIVINKPAGVLTHSKGAFNPEATVATFIAPKLRDQTGDRGGIVHRLDRATSGVIICAKTPEALSFLQKQFSLRKVKKSYQAIVTGTVDPAEAVIDIPIGRNPKDPKSFYPTVHGKTATTTYKVIATDGVHTHLALYPYTGRTHQLRVHLQHIKHPIVGDILYGGEPADRMYLHATSLEITLPSSERKVFESPLPDNFTVMIG